MSSKIEKEKQKWLQDMCQNMLTQMLRDDDNKYCVDCDAKGPRWASWNIGIFLCIRCAGIHRNLGVHISKVKSVNLDSWAPIQVTSLQQMGNSRARAVYEANIPENFRRPQTDSSLEAFIRAKYEQKKYIAKEWIAPPLPEINWDKEWEEEFEKIRRKKKDSGKHITSSMPVRPHLSSVTVPAPLPKPISSSPKLSRTSKTATTLTTTKSSSTPSADLLGLELSTPDVTSQIVNTSGNNSDLDQEFNSFLSASVNDSQVVSAPSNFATVDTNRSVEEDNFFNQPVTNTTKTKQLTTDSILALYGKSQPTVPQAIYNPQGQPQPNLAFPSQPSFAPNFVNRPVAPAQPMGFQNDVSTFPNNQYFANPFYNMGQTQISSQPFSKPSTLNFPMGNLNLGNSGVNSGANQNPLSVVGGQPTFPTQNNFLNQSGTQPTQAVNPLGQTLANNLWQ